MENTKCKHLECNESSIYNGHCSFHFRGGIFGNGETYEQYQVIEEDFINFIKIIPLKEPKNLEVTSPVLRDLIIRCCVQIEMFFKEWAKFEYDEKLLNLYNKLDKRTQEPTGARNWTFKNYYYFKENYISKRAIFIRDLDLIINPFSDWTNNSAPKWWNVYNSIKHDGINSKNECNLEMGLNAISALFLLHCTNLHSRSYLEKFVNITASKKTFGKIKISFDKIKTPIDSKKFLFMDTYGAERSFEIQESRDFQNRAKGIGRDV